MDPTSEKVDHHRRRFFSTAVMTVAAAQLGMAASADSHPYEARSVFFQRISGKSGDQQDRRHSSTRSWRLS